MKTKGALLFLLMVGSPAYADEVTLAPRGADPPRAGRCADAFTLLFDDNPVVVHDNACAVPGARLASGVPRGSLFIVRDRRPVRDRTGYVTLHRHAGIRLVSVDDVAALTAKSNVYLRPAAGDQVVVAPAPAHAVPKDPVIEEFLARLDRDWYADHLDSLAPSDGTRCMCSRGSVRMQNHIASHFKAMGFETTLPTYKGPCWLCDDLDGKNVVAVRRGTARPYDWYLFGAHYDSMAEDACARAPGANDNASGVAALMEIARVLDGVPTDASIMLAAFGGEEWGLLGSREMAQGFDADGMTAKVKGFLALDMISYQKGTRGVLLQGTDRTAAQKAVIDQIAALAPVYTGLGTAITYTYEQDSDHAPFLDRGIPGSLFIEQDWDLYEYYHTNGDTLDKQDMDCGLEMTRLAAAVLATWAGLQPGPWDGGTGDVPPREDVEGQTTETDGAVAPGGDTGPGVSSAGGCGCATMEP